MSTSDNVIIDNPSIIDSEVASNDGALTAPLPTLSSPDNQVNQPQKEEAELTPPVEPNTAYNNNTQDANNKESIKEEENDDDNSPAPNIAVDGSDVVGKQENEIASSENSNTPEVSGLEEAENMEDEESSIIIGGNMDAEEDDFSFDDVKTSETRLSRFKERKRMMTLGGDSDSDDNDNNVDNVKDKNIDNEEDEEDLILNNNNEKEEVKPKRIRRKSDTTKQKDDSTNKKERKKQQTKEKKKEDDELAKIRNTIFGSSDEDDDPNDDDDDDDDDVDKKNGDENENDDDDIASNDDDIQDDDDLDGEAKERLQKLTKKKGSEKKTSKRKKKEKQSEPRKRRKSSQSSESNEPQDSEDIESESPRVPKKPKSSRKGAVRSDQEIRSIVNTYLNQMEDAQLADDELLRQQKPAMTRLILLPKIQHAILNADLQEEFINNNVLGILRKWIEPLPDKSLPNKKMREVILHILFCLDMRYIHEDVLRMSGIGVMVNLYSQHPKETPENKKKAREILDRWIRPVYRLSDSYRDIDDEDDLYGYDRHSSKNSNANKDSKITSSSFEKKMPIEKDPKSSKRARSMGSTGMDYTIKPKSDVTPERVQINKKHLEIKRTLLNLNSRK